MDLCYVYCFRYIKHNNNEQESKSVTWTQQNSNRNFNNVSV